MSTVGTAQTATILSGQTVSNAVDLYERAIVGLDLPAAFTGTALTFQASPDNSTFKVVKKVDGTSYSITVAQNTFVVIPPIDLAGIRFLKIVSGTAEGADRVINVMVRSV